MVFSLTECASTWLSYTQVHKLKLQRYNEALILVRYIHRPIMSGPGLYDPTAIMNAQTLDKCQKEGWAKLAFYLLAFFYYLYG